MSDEQLVENNLELTKVGDEPITLGVVKFDVNEELITRIKSYKELVINGPGDKEGKKKVSAARKETKKEIAKIEKDRKDLVEKALSYQRFVNKEAKGWTETFNDVKTHLESEEDRVEAQEKAEELEKERMEAERLHSRVDRLLKAGLAFSGDKYSISEMEIDAAQVKSLPDSEFDDFVNRAEVAHAEEVKAQAEAKLLKEQQLENERLERELFEKQKKEFEEQQEKFHKEQAELKKQREEETAKLREQQEKVDREKREVEEKRVKARIMELQQFGFEFKGEEYQLSGILEDQSRLMVKVGYTSLKEMNQVEWDNMVAGFKPDLDRYKATVTKLQEEKAAKDKKAAEEKATKAAEEKAAKEKKDKEDLEKKQKDDAERLEQLKPDVQKLTEFAEKLVKGKLPEVVDPAAQQIVVDIKEMFQRMANHIQTKLLKLK